METLKRDGMSMHKYVTMYVCMVPPRIQFKKAGKFVSGDEVSPQFLPDMASCD
jgi:hypothetical protein